MNALTASELESLLMGTGMYKWSLTSYIARLRT